MALTTIPTFTPSGYLSFSTAIIAQSQQTPAGPTPLYLATATVYALPAGSSPATVLVQNLGPAPAYVLLCEATASTTATGSVGAYSFTISSATDVAAGQAVVAAGIPPGAIVTALSGTTVTINVALTAALSSTDIYFFDAVTPQSGIVVQPGPYYVALAYASNTYIQAVCMGFQDRSVLNIAVGV